MGDTTKDQRFHGGCHCGNIRFWFDWPAQAENIPVRACGCSFCTKHGAVWTSHPEGQFQLQITDAFQAKRYQFGQKTADMHVCANCGITPRGPAAPPVQSWVWWPSPLCGWLGDRHHF